MRRKSHPDPITNVTGNTTISQTGKIPPLPFPVQSCPQRSPKGEERIAPWHPFASPAAAQVSALHCAWSLFSRALALASWKTAMQTCTTSAGLTSFQYFAPLPFPAHHFYSSHFSLCSSVFPLTPFPYPILLFALFAYMGHSSVVAGVTLHCRILSIWSATRSDAYISATCFTAAANCSFKIKNWGSNCFLQHLSNLKLF